MEKTCIYESELIRFFLTTSTFAIAAKVKQVHMVYGATITKITIFVTFESLSAHLNRTKKLIKMLKTNIPRMYYPITRLCRSTASFTYSINFEGREPFFVVKGSMYASKISFTSCMHTSTYNTLPTSKHVIVPFTDEMHAVTRHSNKTTNEQAATVFSSNGVLRVEFGKIHF